MSRFQMQIETEYPILFLSDSKSSRTPDTDGRAFVAATTDSLCFFVLSYVDGASLITISDEDRRHAEGELMFLGSLEATSGVLMMSDSNNFQYINVPVPIGSVGVSIWADHKTTPEWVHIKLGAIYTF